MSISRRHLLTGTAAGLAAGTLGAPALLAQSGTRITFAFAPDESGAIQSLVDGFNAANDAGIEVTWTKAPENSDDFFRFMLSDFEAGATDVDVFGSDVIWTAEFAEPGYIEDVSRRVFNEIDTSALLPAALNSAYYHNRLWAVPWFTDAGLLYYRRDLLDEAGIGEPPTTWDELAEAARGVMEASGTASGFVFQGGTFEGGVTNALEFIWSAGGRAWTGQSQVAGAFGMNVSDPNVIVLDSAASAAGLARARAMVDSGIAPPEVTGMNERDALSVFASGDAVFMRNWPFAYGLLGSEEFGPVTREQVGVARIPTLRPGLSSYSCLGGWNLAINAASGKQDAAWAFILWALAPARQRAMAETGGFLPVQSALYEDEALRQAVPVIGLGEEAVRAARARPSSPIYSHLSPRLAAMWTRVLAGDVEPEEAVERTSRELQRIVSNRRY
jgi:multiple sugar transport system substrate-binding protein